MSLFLW